MKYKNAREILPDRLLSELQKYAGGALLYVPARSAKCEWGEKSGARSHYARRNAEITAQYSAGASIETLAHTHCLSEDSIRKIVRECAQRRAQA